MRGSAWAPLLVALPLAALVFPLDGPIARAVAHTGIGDNRELKAWVQYGAIGSLVYAGVVIALLDPPRRRRLWDLAAASVASGVVCLAMKMLIGRPRPRFGDPHTLLWPWGTYVVDGSGGSARGVHAWETLSADLWSMPSSHTAAAAVLSVFLATLYPRLRVPGAVLIAVVALGRVAVGSGVVRDASGAVVGYTYGAHWPSDVVMGAGVGLAVGRAVVRRGLGAALARRVGGSTGGTAAGADRSSAG